MSSLPRFHVGPYDDLVVLSVILALLERIRLGALFGIATERDGRNGREVVAAADAAMYLAKRQGGDRIAVARPFEASA